MDFAADAPFALVQLKLREHYGFEIGESTIQRITLGHAGAIFASGRDVVDFPRGPGQHKQIVVQTDGGLLIPIMAPDASQKDKRKGKTLSWREAKISLGMPREAVHRFTEAGSKAAWRKRGGGFSPARSGPALEADSRVHAVGDGAPWIMGQVDELFGEQGSYLIDFYHVCEYLSAAAKAVAQDANRDRGRQPPGKPGWMRERTR